MKYGLFFGLLVLLRARSTEAVVHGPQAASRHSCLSGTLECAGRLERTLASLAAIHTYDPFSDIAASMAQRDRRCLVYWVLPAAAQVSPGTIGGPFKQEEADGDITL